jgi:flavin reductase (DIM6/NTAB) family NADH-FMN oxidoreductase RutF
VLQQLKQMLVGSFTKPTNTEPVVGSALDERHLRTALGRFVTGVTVLTTRTAEGRLEGLTANSFSAVSLEPPLVLWSLKDTATSLPSFESAGHFAVNVLGAWQLALAQHFAKRNDDKFKNVVHAPGLGGCPLLFGALATFECSRESIAAGGDHVVFFGRIQRASYRDGEPLTFGAGKYGTHSILEGTLGGGLE